MWMQSDFAVAACVVGLVLCLVALLAVVVAPCAKKSVGGIAFAVAVVCLTPFAGDKPEPPPPVIVVKDIEVKTYSCDHTGCRMSWACGTNIVLGVDKFIVQRATRQIPARIGWSAYEDYGETTTTNWATATPQHSSDVRWKIVVRKEAD